MLLTETKIKASTFGVSHDMAPFDYLNKKQLVKLTNLVTYHPEFDDKSENSSISKVWSIINLLEVDKIYLLEKNSMLDSYLKIDMIVKSKSRYIGFQLKSNKFDFDKYINKYKNTRINPYGYGSDKPTYSDIKSVYPAPGCIWCNDKSNSSEMLLGLSTWFNIPISLKTAESYKKFKMLRSSGIKELDGFITRTFRITSDDINIWSVLGKCKIIGRELHYL